MDQFVRVIVWIALFGGTGAVVLMILPRIVVWCLEIVDGIQITRSNRRALMARRSDSPEPLTHPPNPVHPG